MPSKRKASSSRKRSARSKQQKVAEGEDNGVVVDDAASTTEGEGGGHVEGDDWVDDSRFIGNSYPAEDAKQLWPHRYQEKPKRNTNSSQKVNGDGDEDPILAKCHYSMGEVDGIFYKLEDDAQVKGEDGDEDYICRIVEIFEGVDGSPYFTAQWYYRAKDTVIKSHSSFIDNKRVFFSDIKNDNPLHCLVRKLVIVRLPLHVHVSEREAATSGCDYYCDTKYLLPYASFVNLPKDNLETESEPGSTVSTEAEDSHDEPNKREEMSLLDLYSGCGGMSTGLCLGSAIPGVKLVTKWAVDMNAHACESMKYNHPETEVRNESAEDFLALLKEWRILCHSYHLIGNRDSQHQVDSISVKVEDTIDGDVTEDDSEEFEVEKVLAICYGDPNSTKKSGLYLKIRWKGYGPQDDTWEPFDGLCGCQDKIKEFVSNGFKSKLLPLPGAIDVICGGPPCQGISGFNRFRNKADPLKDPKNKQLVVFMDIVDFLKPRFVLMENVVDIVKFSGGFLGRYALGRLVGLNYQTRIGMMVAGAYGLPQFRMRFFMWGASPTENLPQFPLPIYNVIMRGNTQTIEFEFCTVAYDEANKPELGKELFLDDAISDLPPVENDESRDEMPYTEEPKTEFQKFIRLRKDELLGSASTSNNLGHSLFDHRPLHLNNDDYLRVCQIPKKKGANFRDLKGVRVKENNIVEFDPDVERVLLPSGKPLVPNYAMSFNDGASSKPFGRLWWDETVPTVVTRAEPHNQVILHPLQDRVLTVRENARLQGFPDYYKFSGPIKERYTQVGNAVAVPVSRALGYSLALAVKKSSEDGPLMTLPKNFPNIHLSAPAIVHVPNC